ncbi:methionine ABC transporter ATP-binding protein [Canibacter sp. lx-45]|uniref:methionine ABC transporter ATP-binding protein n=1 Tax=Canibacter zhuwentaonis TaxID=2837491 RepID=UPI001BDBFBAD|nr:methionine ABC transporter ATP-binding protein [Canibacter zhuwentaonis]MBT1035107.1 methionine ABC transporter ATP-binding protein [Canibacter zhuwentaonis]
MSRVVISDVSKTYGENKNRAGEKTPAVDNVSIDIAAGEIHAIIGYSGAGKSTLLRLINGLERADSGFITVGDSANIVTMKESELRQERHNIGMIFQQFNLFHSKTVGKNVEYPLTTDSRNRLNVKARRLKALEMLEFVGLADKIDTYTEQLSGGQKQRVGIARALATNPEVLLADEATSALDPETSQDVLRLLARVNREFGVTIILVTHEMEVVREIAHRVTVMEQGRIIEQGNVFDVFANAKSYTTKRFVATAMPTTPDQKHIELLKEKHRGKLVTVTMRDGDVDQPLVFNVLAELGVGVSIVHGGITSVGERSFGKLMLELIGETDSVKSAIAALHKVTELEVLA